MFSSLTHSPTQFHCGNRSSEFKRETRITGKMRPRQPKPTRGYAHPRAPVRMLSAEEVCVCIGAGRAEANSRAEVLSTLAVGIGARLAASAGKLDAFIDAVVTEAQRMTASCTDVLRASVAARRKAMEAMAEEEKVTGEQLAAYADTLDHAIQCDLPLDAPALRPVQRAIPNWLYSSVIPSGAFLARLPDTCMRVRAGIDVSKCTTTGLGLEAYAVTPAGDTQAANIIEVCARDDRGRVIASVAPADVSVQVTGASVASVAVLRPGVLSVCYRVAAGPVADLSLSLSLFGYPLPTFPITVPAPLRGSAILDALPAPLRARFLLTLTSLWLPRSVFTPLYIGSRDGMTPRAFHTHCDGKGPTLVLIRSADGCSFGGYASVSWVCEEHGRLGVWRDARRSFLFSLQGPQGEVVRFRHRAGAGVCAWSKRGPIFGAYDLIVQAARRGDDFDASSVCEVGANYGSPGALPLATSRTFLPQLMEVYAVHTLRVP